MKVGNREKSGIKEIPESGRKKVPRSKEIIRKLLEIKIVRWSTVKHGEV